MIILYRSLWYTDKLAAAAMAVTAKAAFVGCSIAKTVSLRRHAQRGLCNYGLEENKKGNHAEEQNCRVELRVEVESKVAPFYSLEIGS